MTTKAKLMGKLLRGTIDGKELRTLFKQRGWYLDRVKGSHEIWCRETKTFVLATHSKDLKPYQIQEAKQCLLGEEKHYDQTKS